MQLRSCSQSVQQWKPEQNNSTNLTSGVGLCVCSSVFARFSAHLCLCPSPSVSLYRFVCLSTAALLGRSAGGCNFSSDSSDGPVGVLGDIEVVAGSRSSVPSVVDVVANKLANTSGGAEVKEYVVGSRLDIPVVQGPANSRPAACTTSSSSDVEGRTFLFLVGALLHVFRARVLLSPGFKTGAPGNPTARTMRLKPVLQGAPWNPREPHGASVSLYMLEIK